MKRRTPPLFRVEGRKRIIVLALFCAFACRVGAADDAKVWIQTNQEDSTEAHLFTWDFETSAETPADTQGWSALHDCTLEAHDGALLVRSTGGDPYCHCPVPNLGDVALSTSRVIGEAFVLKVYFRKTPSSDKSMAIYWTNAKYPHYTEDASARARKKSLTSVPTGASDTPEWAVAEIPFESDATLSHIRLDPANAPAEILIDKIELYARSCSPIEMELLPPEDFSPQETFPSTPQVVKMRLTNRRKDEPVEAKINGQSVVFREGEEKILEYTSNPEKPLDLCVWRVETDFGAVERRVRIVHAPKALSDDPRSELPQRLRLKDGTTPLPPRACAGGEGGCAKIYFCTLENKEQGSDEQILCAVTLDENEYAVHIPGVCRWGVLPGVELLEEGEWSSSKLDNRTEEHNRFCPSPDLLTQQWMGVVTPRALFALQWENSASQPTFAIPNFADGTQHARLGLTPCEGDTPTLSILPASGDLARDSVELVRRAFLAQRARFHRKSLATPEELPREELFSLYRFALESGGLRSSQGWGHCIESRWVRQPFVGHASALDLLGGKVEFGALVDGGTHIENPRAYFLRNEAEVFAQRTLDRAQGAQRAQSSDGTFLYHGKYAEGHFENHALGTCASHALSMLRGYLVSGDVSLLASARKTLEYSRRYQVARGAQCWEMPLHTPDLLAVAHAIRANVLAFRITKESAFLDEARRRAWEGVPYIYWWDAEERPFQFGASIGVLGATNWRAPNWIGRPVQWIGTVYAYGLLDLAEVLGKNDSERAIWREVAEAITHSGERQVYKEGISAGLLPDSVDPTSLERYMYDINPTALIFLRLRLSGTQENVEWIWNEKFRIVSPVAVDFVGESELKIDAPAGVVFQILVNGRAKVVQRGTIFLDE
ncbi:MAG: hypothetical protein Q4D38_03985 [Planctomycetia bacterium]|nr:hypothetical protein [Planctomycetia bacterium]